MKKPIPRYSRDKRSPIPKDERTSRVMSANRSKNTAPEVALRKALRKIGLSNYKLHVARIAGKPDIVFKEKKLAVFVNGCFWHRCPFCKQSIPKTNSAFWRAKFKRNVARDKRNISQLKKDDWKVVVIWECRIKKNLESAAAKVAKAYAS